MISQTMAVITINLRSIPQRWGMSLSTIVSIALVVGVLLGFMAMANGFRATVQSSGSDVIAVIVRGGAQSEINSNFDRDTVRLVEAAPGVARDGDGKAILSPELYVVVEGVKRSSGAGANLPLRGVGDAADALRENFTMLEGRMFAEGSNELVVGEGVIREFSGFDLDTTIRLGTGEWRVVGVFSTGGSVFDSEIWADVGVIQNLYQRGGSFQSIRVRLEDETALDRLREYVDAEPRLDLDISTERQYFADSAGGLADVIMFLGWPLVIIMATGALAGAWNAMYASVDSRMREIATLRTLGFSGFAAFMGTMAESLLLALIGGVIGAAITYLIFDGISASTLGGSFTQIVFSFAVTSKAMINGVILALIVGLIGGFFPALRASRVPLLSVHG